MTDIALHRTEQTRLGAVYAVHFPEGTRLDHVAQDSPRAMPFDEVDVGRNQRGPRIRRLENVDL